MEISIYLSEEKAQLYSEEYAECSRKISKSRSRAAKAPTRRTWSINLRYESNKMVGYLCVQDVASCGRVGRYETQFAKIPRKFCGKAISKLKKLNSQEICELCKRPL